MSRAKNTTRIANIHIGNMAQDSTWITNHSIGILNTVLVNETSLLDESGGTLTDEAGLTLLDELLDTNTEVTTISFVGDARATPSGTPDTDSAEVYAIANEDDTTIATFDGLIDEVKLSDKSRPSSVAITSYNAEKADSDIITKGTKVTQ
jgi:hypothetical protein